MAQIKLLREILSKFSPQGQELALQTLKENRQILSQRLGFAELPSIIAGQGKTKLLEEQLVNKSDSIRGIVCAELDKCAKTLSADELRNNMLVLNMVMLCRNGKSVLRNITKELAPNLSAKKNLLSEFAINELGDKKLAQNILQEDCIEELIPLIKSAIQKSTELSMNNVRKMIGYSTPERQFNYDFRCRQIFSQFRQLDADRQLILQKIILSQSTDKEIIVLENMLRKKYNLEYIHLTDKKQAELLEHSLEIAKKNGIEIPSNIIYSPLSTCGPDAGIHLKHSNGSHTIMLNTNNEILEAIKEIPGNKGIALEADTLSQQLKQTSTNSPYHAILHEIIHGEGSSFTISPQKIKKLKAQEQVLTSGYAKVKAQSGNFEEVRTELRTKEVLEGLTTSEKEYLDLIS